MGEGKTEVEITQEALQLLYQTLGVADTTRFLSQFIQPQGNYTEEREAIYKNKTVEELISQIREERKSS